MFFKKKKETDADVLEKIKEKITEDENKQQATNENKVISDEDFLNDVLAEADVIESQNENNKIKQTQEEQKVLESINKVVQDAVNKNDNNSSQIKDVNTNNNDLLDDLIKESDVSGNADMAEGQYQLESNNQQQDKDENDLNSKDKDGFDDDLLDDVVDEDVSTGNETQDDSFDEPLKNNDDNVDDAEEDTVNETQNDSSDGLLENNDDNVDVLDEDTVSNDDYEDGNVDSDLMDDDNYTEDDNENNNDDDQELLNNDETDLDIQQEDKNIGAKEITKNTPQESEYQNDLHNDEDLIKTSKQKLFFPDVSDNEGLSNDERFDLNEADDEDHYVDEDFDSMTTKRRKNYELNTHVSDETKSNVKGSITDLIESVKNQVLTSRQISGKNSGGSKTLEQFVADILRPQLIGYLDKNLDRIVKEIVRDEIQKIVDGVNDK